MGESAASTASRPGLGPEDSRLLDSWLLAPAPDAASDPEDDQVASQDALGTQIGTNTTDSSTSNGIYAARMWRIATQLILVT